jgi:Tfp pilus assembly protein PilE
MLVLKKGAMFGLDARIALAIFGALSVISGAALYSAIQNSKVTALLTEMNEVGKAYDAYYLDTGNELAALSVDSYLDVHKLVSSTEKGWAGPYLSYVASSENFSLEHPQYDRVRIGEMLDGDWTDNTATTWIGTTNCSTGTVGSDCNVWIVFRDVQLEIYNALDKLIDGSLNTQSGNVRMVTWSGIPNVVFLKYRPKQN